MSLSKIYAQKRLEDTSLKTQLRFGQMDIEVYMKYRGEQVGYRLVKLEDFTDISMLLDFDQNIKWKRYTDRPPRRKVDYRNLSSPSKRAAMQQARPVTGQIGGSAPDAGQENTLIRANSNNICSEKN